VLKSYQNFFGGHNDEIFSVFNNTAIIVNAHFRLWKQDRSVKHRQSRDDNRRAYSAIAERVCHLLDDGKLR
jgi:hypothetical protein